MTSKELQKKNDKDLAKELVDLRNKLREFRFGMSGGQTRNTKDGAALRKKIAQVLTELNSRKVTN